MNFGQAEAEILGLNHTRGHFHFSHEYVRNYPITVFDPRNLHLTSCFTFSDIFHENNPGFNFNQKITKVLIFENSETENVPWCVPPPISQPLCDQNSKSRTVLKSSEPADFTLYIW